MVEIPAAWHQDPTGRFQLRYWDGTQWTEHVSNHGITASDPLPSAAPAVAATTVAAAPTPVAQTPVTEMPVTQTPAAEPNFAQTVTPADGSGWAAGGNADAEVDAETPEQTAAIPVEPVIPAAAVAPTPVETPPPEPTPAPVVDPAAAAAVAATAAAATVSNPSPAAAPSAPGFGTPPPARSVYDVPGTAASAPAPAGYPATYGAVPPANPYGNPYAYAPNMAAAPVELQKEPANRTFGLVAIVAAIVLFGANFFTFRTYTGIGDGVTEKATDFGLGKLNIAVAIIVIGLALWQVFGKASVAAKVLIIIASAASVLLGVVFVVARKADVAGNSGIKIPYRPEAASYVALAAAVVILLIGAFMKTKQPRA